MGKEIRADQNYTKQPFLLSVDEIVNEAETSLDVGLNSTQVQQKQQNYGPNNLQEMEASPGTLFLANKYQMQ